MSDRDNHSRPSDEDAYRHTASLVRYDKDTGIFYWLYREEKTTSDKVFNINFAGRECGSLDSFGYVRMCVVFRSNTFFIRAHRLAWLIESGEMPEDEVDHINGVRNDNRIVNLRCVCHSMNSRNKRMYSNNKSGITGVSWDRRSQKWKAQVKENGKCVFLGTFQDIEEAAKIVAQFKSSRGYTLRHGI